MTGSAEWRGPVGDVWAEEWRRTDRAFAVLSRALDAAILAAAPAGAFRALDIGCGAGATSLALAAARPDADIVGVDLSPALVATARERGAVHTNLTFEVEDATRPAAAGTPFDLLYSRHGVMFFPDPAHAFAALRDTARPGGALIFSCFADPEANAFAGPLARSLDLPPPQAGAAPGPFAFADPDHVARLLAAAGWRDLRHEAIAFPYRVGGGDAALDDAVGLLSRIGPVAAAMRGSDPARRLVLRGGLRAFLAEYLNDNAVDLPAAAWLWSARA